MKRVLLALVLVAAALTAILGYASSRREGRYREFIEQGDAALARGESVTAVEAFTIAITLKPDSMLGYLKRGEAYRRYGELEMALKDLRTASRLDPSATRPLELLGDVEHALRRYDRAADRYLQYVRIDDRSPRVLYKLALARYHAGNPAGAIDALVAATAIEENFAEAHYLTGLCLEALGKRDAARASLQRAIAIAPALFDAREELADLSKRTSRTDDHLFHLEALQALDLGSPSRYVALGLAHADAGQFDRAVTVLGRAAERFPSHAYTYVALGRVWLDAALARGDDIALQKAIEALERAVAAEPSSEAFLLLGRALLASGRPEQAANAFADATEKRPVEPLAFYHLADAAERIGNYPAARNALLDYQALEGDPADPRRRARVYERLADLSMKIGEPATAVTWFQRAAIAHAGDVDAAFLLRFGEAQWQAGDLAAARESANKALEKEPGNRAARLLLRRIR